MKCEECQEDLPRIEGVARAPEKIGLPKLVGDIRVVFHHPALALYHFSPFSVLLFAALEKLRCAIDTHPAKRRLIGASSRPTAFLG